MKKIFTYIALATVAVLTACSDDDIAQSSSVTDSLDKYAVTGTMVSSAEFEEGPGDVARISSKSQLYYDRINNKLKFTWTTGDKIGIFPEGEDEEDKDDQFPFILDSATPLNVQDSYVTGVFEPFDKEAAYPIEVTKKYYSYFPFKAQTLETGDFTYNAVPISFEGQTQTTNEQMDYYWQALYGEEAYKEANKEAFLESEKAATAHLAAYDYMIADATSTAAAHVHLNYSHMASIVRFYMMTPVAANLGLFIDSLQVYNSDANFTLDATMNIVEKTLTPTKTSHVVSLKFEPSIDMTNNSDATKPSYHYWDRDYPADGYIMAYMMLAPINLNLPEVDNSKLYMIARQPKYYTTAAEYNAYYGLKDGDVGYLANDDALNALKQADKMKVYKDVDAYNAAKEPDITAEAFAALPVDKKLIDPERKTYAATLSKINFQAGKHHQWIPNLNPDEPIKFHEITIQQWQEGPGFTNEDGEGTADW